MKGGLCLERIMKPLAIPGSMETGSGCGEISMKRLHVVGILKPEEEVGDEGKGWVLVVAVKGLYQGKEFMKNGKNCVGELNFSPSQRLKLFRRLSPKKLAINKENLYMGKFLLYDHGNGKSLKINSSGENPEYGEFFTVTISKAEHTDLVQNQKCKLVDTDELADYSVFLVPLDGLGSNEGNFTSGPTSSKRGLGPAAERIFMRLERRFLTSEHFPLFFSRKQWKSLMGCVTTLQERLWSKNTGKDGENGRGFLRWIKRGGGDAGKRQRWVRNGGVVADEGETEEEEDDDTMMMGEGLEKRKLVRKAMIKKKKQRNQGKLEGAAKNNGKVNRINFPGGGGGDKGRKTKTKRHEEDYADEDSEKDNQLIRIELKPDPLIQDSSFQFCSGDLLRLKVTMFESLRQKKANFHQYPYEHDEYEVEIDFVQNFVCETNTVDGCRCRRISKLLERAVVQDLKWEKGVHISGQQFALCWIPYRIPMIFNNNGSGLPVGIESLDSSKFKVAGTQYEMQIRLYGTDQEKISRFVLSACIFPLNIMAMESISNNNGATGTAVEGGRNVGWIGTGGDILQVFQAVVEEDEEEDELDHNLPIVGVDTRVTKSLSATEFDV